MVSEGLKTKGVEMQKVMGILLFVMVAGMALAQQGAVVATADGIKITEEDLVAELRTMNVQQAKQMLTEQGKVQLLNRVIRRKLVLKAAKDAKADTAEAVKRGWQRAKDDVLINYMVAMKAQEVPKPTEEEAKSYYDKNDSLFFAPKAMHIQRIVVPDKGTADIVIAALKGGAAFDALMKNYPGTQQAQSGDLGFVAEANIDTTLLKIFSPLKDGENTDPMPMGNLYVIFRLVERRDAGVLPFEKIKDVVLNNLYQTKQQLAVKDYEDALVRNAQIQVDQEALKTFGEAKPADTQLKGSK